MTVIGNAWCNKAIETPDFMQKNGGTGLLIVFKRVQDHPSKLGRGSVKIF